MTWGRLAIGAVATALIVFLLLRFGDAREEAGRLEERAAWHEAQAEAERENAEVRVAAERRVTAAVQTYADKVARIAPIVVRATDTVTRYAETPAGRELCLPAERVRGIQALDAELNAAARDPGQGAAALHDPRAPR
ncbi:hypothetical protein GGR88_001320 [Sphingomonas jejuensis]|uniref:Uncharacterized protein n=1 Tax=Sphingomonas jejuensis TaxID=904715 RepID=A0ABX0XMD1_9SPHN|nr:hypothetical protein [Sphingomonas jejuensis]NJC33846.1 hypothetical protein [Sphingomonas jejuensis]